MRLIELSKIEIVNCGYICAGRDASCKHNTESKMGQFVQNEAGS